MPFITCPACGTNVSDQEADGRFTPHAWSQHLNRCEILYWDESNGLSCVCGKQLHPFGFSGILHHLRHEPHDWPKLLVVKTLEEM